MGLEKFRFRAIRLVAKTVELLQEQRLWREQSAEASAFSEAPAGTGAAAMAAGQAGPGGVLSSTGSATGDAERQRRRFGSQRPLIVGCGRHGVSPEVFGRLHVLRVANG